MKTLLVIACLVLLLHHTKPVQGRIVTKQQKLFTLLHVPAPADSNFDYYRIAIDYKIEDNINNYTNKKAVEEFLTLYKRGFLPKYETFSIFHEEQKQQAIALFRLFFYANDFEIFYRTACFARVYINESIFLYAFFIAIYHRSDTQGVVIPAPYEIYPEYFVNTPVFFNAYWVKMQNGIFSKDEALQYGIVAENNNYIFYSNYSDSLTYPNDEYKLSYFTEDIGLNAYYFYFHAFFPFWMDGNEYPLMKERRGEIYYYFYQQLLARYYLERLSNGLGEIPEFSWRYPIKTGYYAPLDHNIPYAQRPNDYQIPYKNHIMELQFLDTYEKTFIQYLEKIHFKVHNNDVDLSDPKSINFVGNYWQGNYDMYKFYPKKYHHSYEICARHVLGAAPEPVDKYTFQPTALSFYQTSLRDPIFYQLYNKILGYVWEYKQYVKPYTPDSLYYDGIKINDVKVSNLVTYFDYYDFDISGGLQFSLDELLSVNYSNYKVRQPRLNQKPFTINIDVKSDVESESVFKFFLGPKYDSNGYPMTLEENWKYFVVLDWFVHKLTPGQNKIERSSTDFFIYKDDSITRTVLFNMTWYGEVPADLSKKHEFMPRRLMLPKGTQAGFPYQLFVMVYPYEPAEEKQRIYFVDNKPLGYPLDRPVYKNHFKQPNMFFKDVQVYHKGEKFLYNYNVPPFNV